MAKTKKAATSPKTLDLTANKTSSKVTAWVKKVDKDLVTVLKKSDITVFGEIAAGKDVVRAYFLSYGYFVGILSDGALLTFKRIFHDVLVDNIASTARDAMLRSGANYPGHWDFFKIKVIAASVVSMEMIDGKMTLSLVLPTENDDVISKPVMPFEDYNPNRLYQYATAAVNSVIAMVEAEVAAVIPSSRRIVGAEKLNERYGREFHELIVKGCVQFPEDGDIPEDMDDAAEVVLGAIKAPIVAYAISLVNESGLDLRFLREVLKRSKDKFMYSADTNTGRVAAGFVHPWVKVDYFVYRENDPAVRPTFSASMSDIRAIFGKDPSASCKARIGMAFQRWVEALVTYAMKVAADEPDSLFMAQRQETIDMEAPAEDDNGEES